MKAITALAALLLCAGCLHISKNAGARLAATVPISTNFILQPWMTWPAANPLFTNQVPSTTNEIDADWRAMRVQWFGDTNVVYEVQFCEVLNGPWKAYAVVCLTNYSGHIMCDYPIFDGQNRFLRVMR
jgi:hypothetical protein